MTPAEADVRDERDRHFEDLAARGAVDHRFPWAAAQRWEQVLFLNWRVPAAMIRPLVPTEVDVDTYQGDAWVSLLPLRMAHVHLHGMMPLPHLTDFPELNLRTYVVKDGVAGVWFLSLDAPSHLAVWLGRHVFHLPYDPARMEMVDQAGFVSFSSDREGAPARFDAVYRGVGDAAPPAPGSVEEFLCERYAMYAVNHEGRLRRGDIHHDTWQLTKAEVRLGTASVIDGAGFSGLGAPDSAYYSEFTENVVWPMVKA